VRAELTFVRSRDGEHHNVWIRREDGTTLGCRLHVRHDLAHLVVESVLGVDDGLWGALVRDGLEPGLTDSHLVAKRLTNAVVNRWGDGADDAEGVRYRVLEQAPPVMHRRRTGFDPASMSRRARLAADRLAAASDDDLRMAIAGVRTLERRWTATPLGETMRLSWLDHRALVPE
jgi:hypothetical protein